MFFRFKVKGSNGGPELARPRVGGCSGCGASRHRSQRLLPVAQVARLQASPVLRPLRGAVVARMIFGTWFVFQKLVNEWAGGLSCGLCHARETLMSAPSVPSVPIRAHPFFIYLERMDGKGGFSPPSIRSRVLSLRGTDARERMQPLPFTRLHCMAPGLPPSIPRERRE